MSLIISLDIGTSKLVAMALSTESLKPIAICSRSNDSEIKALPKDHHEQDPKRILDLCLELIAEVLADGAVNVKDIAGVGITGQMHGVMLVNKDMQPCTNLITWQDQRVLQGSFYEKIKSIGQKACGRTGCGLHAGYGGVTLSWLSKNSQIPNDAFALSIADYVTACLTGVVATEPTHAASWGIFSLAEMKWDEDLIAELEIDISILPEVIQTGKVQGELLADHSSLFGLSKNIKVCSSIGDNQASIIGAAGFSNDAAVLNIGSGGQISVVQDKFVFVSSLETRPMPIGGFIMVGASLYGGLSFAYLKDFFKDVVKKVADLELSDEEVYTKMKELVSKDKNFSSGLSVDTRFAGTRFQPSQKGVITGIDKNNFNVANLTFAFIEGIVNELIAMIPAHNIKDVNKFIATGNAVQKNPLMCDVVKSSTSLPCFISKANEEAALGAAFTTVIGLGLISQEDIKPQLEEVR